jgi:FtsP/CotA-like multicopper oxidase with cupredoxin domain
MPDGSVQFQRTSPGPTFEQTRLIPAQITYLNEIAGAHPLAVDPTLDWANPNNFPKPTPPFLPFPPGYPQAQSPVAHTTHTHGIEVLPGFDGTPDTWFTPNQAIRGPEFVSNIYTQPSSNQATAFWYHDHAFGTTRLDVGFGLSGFSILRDPNNPLDPPIGGNASTLGMEDPYEWTGTGVTPDFSAQHTEGESSVALRAQNYVTIKSRTFALTQALASTITMDFFLPTQQPNPYWLGAVQLYLDCPSKAVNNAYVGQVELTGKTIGAWNRLSFPVSSTIRSSVGSSCTDFDLSIAVNVPFNATGLYLVDNVLGIPKTATTVLPHGEFEVPMIVQDRSFRTDGSIWYPTVGRNPDINPYWELIVDGQTVLVNGKVWPTFNVKRHAYRFRVLNSANQRFFRFALSNGMPVTIIGNDGGFLRTAQQVPSWIQGVTERDDVIIDFSQLAPGTKVILQNLEQHFPPIGAAVDPTLDGRVMQFVVQDGPAVPPKTLPSTLATIPTLVADRPKRTLIQNVELDDQGRILQAELDGQLFHELTTELPTIGSTDEWQFVNTTPLDHNKHVHLIEFQLVDRVPINAAQYRADWVAVNGNPPFAHPTIKLDVTPYITGPATGPDAWEAGWKDTIRTPAGMATRIRIRWAPQIINTVAPGQNLFPVDPTYGIGYVWHCHLVEHEDNEMMRPMGVIDIWRPGKNYGVGFYGSPGVYHDVVDYQGIDYSSRVPHTSVATQPPPTRFDLWQRINNQNGDWAVQIIYDVGDRARFGTHIYRALVHHQATTTNQPDISPTFWEVVL